MRSCSPTSSRRRARSTQTGLYRALVDRWRNVPGGQGWSALVGLFTSVRRMTDIGLLAALGLIASQAGGPLLAGADLALAGDDADALAGWQALRRSEAAPWIGLAAPRVLLRLPYGKGSDPIEAFAFEEFDGPPAHDDFLWGNASLATALLIGKAFTARGWDMELGDEREIGDLPAYTFVRDGEREMQACAERFLHRERDQHAAEGGTHSDRQPPRPQCGGGDPVSVGIGSAGATGLVNRHLRSRHAAMCTDFHDRDRVRRTGFTTL